MKMDLLRRIPGWSTQRIASSVTDQDSVRPGDRFYSIGQYSKTWVVKRVVTPDGLKIPHVELICEERSIGTTKAIALTALLSKNHFARERRANIRDGYSVKGRRRTDDPRRCHIEHTAVVQ